MDTTEEYIKVLIVYSTVQSLFLLICVCNLSKYYFLFVWKANNVKVKDLVKFMDDFHLCTLESA